MKKLGKLLIGIIFLSFLVGCNDVHELTDDETKVIAEYAADLLLKYDVSFDDRISEGEFKLQKQEERQENVSTQSLTEEDITEEMTEEATTENNQGSYVSGTIGDIETESDSSSVTAATDIADILNQQDVSITYKDYLITEQYPATDEEGKFIYLDASEGYELLVLRFQVTNMSSQVYNLSLLDEEVDYKIVCNESKAAKPMLTILMDDLSTLETTIEPGENQEAVLVFQISDSLKNQLQKIQLFIEYNDMNYVMDIQ